MDKSNQICRNPTDLLELQGTTDTLKRSLKLSVLDIEDFCLESEVRMFLCLFIISELNDLVTDREVRGAIVRCHFFLLSLLFLR